MVYGESMSHLLPQAITEFQALWKKHVGTDLPTEQASSRANEVFAVLRLVLEQPAHVQTASTNVGLPTKPAGKP